MDKCKVGYWKWMYEGIKGLVDWAWNEMRLIVYYLIFVILYWVLVAVLFAPFIYLTHYISYFLLIWIILSILIVSYGIYMEEKQETK